MAYVGEDNVVKMLFGDLVSPSAIKPRWQLPPSPGIQAGFSKNFWSFNVHMNLVKMQLLIP